MELIEEIRGDIVNTAAKHAADVDERARFPAESFAALRAAGALSAAVPRELGGLGCTLRQLAAQCSALAQGCSASAMILAMHHIQIACMARHGMTSPFFREYLSRVAREQLLVASATSEVGTFGDTRSSVCAVEREGERFTLNKEATTISYGQSADALLATCRRAAMRRPAIRCWCCSKGTTTGWNRPPAGTPWECAAPAAPASRCAPAAHGIRYCRGRSPTRLPRPWSPTRISSGRRYGMALPPMPWRARRLRCAAKRARSRGRFRLRPRGWQGSTFNFNPCGTIGRPLADSFDGLTPGAGGLQELLGIGWALKLNNLKVDVSESVVQIVHQALQIIGILGYKNDSPVSVGRHLPRRSIRAADGLERAHRRQERVAAVGIQSRSNGGLR